MFFSTRRSVPHIAEKYKLQKRYIYMAFLFHGDRIELVNFRAEHYCSGSHETFRDQRHPSRGPRLLGAPRLDPALRAPIGHHRLRARALRRVRPGSDQPGRGARILRESDVLPARTAHPRAP